MIKISMDKTDFHLSTANTSYIIRLADSGHPVNLYYGKKLREKNSYNNMHQTYSLWTGSSTCYSTETGHFSLDTACLEAPLYGKGDYREPFTEINFCNGTRVCDFIYKSHRIYEGENKLQQLPHAFRNNDNVETLELALKDEYTDLTLILSYTVYYERNVITRSSKLINNGDAPVSIEKLMSFNLDFSEADFELLTLDGKWISERNINTRKLSEGIFLIDSKKGVSSANHNPFLCLKRSKTSENAGECYGFSLIYSGNHIGLAEVNPYSFTRIQMGINPFDFSWRLEPGEDFQTPEAVLTYSDTGLNGMSRNFHELINNNIVNTAWQYKARPVLINNWEATYFDFNESRLLKLADEAVKLGIELFVLDDGWFGRRDDDHSSLGDWYENRKKLPGGLERLGKKLHAKGLQFGLWVEPEMVNVDSELYKAHPDWAIKIPERPASEGRFQLMLDYANHGVINYMYEVLSNLFRRAGLQYVKWDCNRNLSDLYSNILPEERQKEQAHRYVLGLYRLLERLKNDFPHILFESCASGGNRFDLGMLYYMPQTWTSDNTDAVERISIQYGTSMVFPPSVMGAHVSAAPSHQVLRNTPLETRFNVAAFGLLGYELDLIKLSNFEKKTIKQQIADYKTRRSLFQYGDFYRLKSPFSDNQPLWITVSKDKKNAVLGYYQILQKPNGGFEQLKTVGLEPDMMYNVTTRRQYVNIRAFGNLVNHISPIKLKADGILHTVISNNYMLENEVEEFEAFGDELMFSGIRPYHQFTGTGYTEKTRLIGDFGSRLYFIKSEQAEDGVKENRDNYK